MKNKHLCDAISKQFFYKFKRKLEYKCKLSGIDLLLADRFYHHQRLTVVVRGLRKI